MTDLSQTIAPKSDQLNADDLIGGPKTIKVTRVSATSGDDQPVAIFFEGDNGKPYKPCKSMRRLLVHVWGSQGKTYAGRRMTLFRDDAVQFGGTAVGGVRISHLSGIEKRLTMLLTVARTKRVAYTVQPLPEETASGQPSPRDRLYSAARAEAAKGENALKAFRAGLEPKADQALAPILDELLRTAAAADDDGFPGADAIDERAA